VTVARPKTRIAVVATCLALAGAAVSWAYWSASATTGSAGNATAASVNQGATPTATASSTVGRRIAVSWGASTLSNGNAVDGYIVKRYDAGTGTPQTTLAGCSGTIAATSCTETGVPPGSWKYTVTPVLATNWQGVESTKSGAATVAPAALTLAKTTFGAPLPQTTTGSLTGFAPNEGLSFRLDSGPGTTLTGSPSSVDANGNATISSLTIPSGTADGAHTVYALGNFSPVASQASSGIVVDTVAPVVTASLSPAANGAGWNNTSPVSVTLSATDATSGVNQIKYTTDGSDPTTSGTATVYSTPFSVGNTPPVINQTVAVNYFATDNAGNASTVQTKMIEIDTVAPIDAISLSGVSGGATLSGSTVYYNGNNSGSFKLSNALTDTGGSGPASTGYAALSGASGNWSFTSSSVTSGPPYVSNTFSWTPGTASPSEAVTGADNAGNTAPTTLTLTADTTGPTGGALTVNSVAASGAGSTSANTTGAFTIGTRTDYNSDAGSGVASSVLTRQSASYTSTNGTAAGTCGSFGGTTTITGQPAQSALTTGCYLYTLTGTDNVGNTSTISTTVKVDTTPPSTPTITLSGATGNTFIAGTTAYINAQPGKSGGFSAAAVTSDGDSGIASVSFSTPSGFTGGGSVTSSPFTAGYTWSGAAGTGSQTVTATNGAGGTTSGAFSITADTVAPTTTDNAPSGWHNTSQTVTLSPTDNSGGSGVKSTYYTTDGSTPTTSSTQGTSVSLTSDGVYTIKYFSTDNVGNQEAVKTATNQVQIDKTNPNAPAIGLTGSYTNAGTTYIKNGQALTDAATDPTVGGASSGVSSVQYLYCSGSACTPNTSIGTSTTGPNYSLAWNSQPADGTYTIAAKVTDAAGNTATSTPQTIVIDNTAPAGSITNPAAGTVSGTVSLTSNPTDSSSGVASVSYSYCAGTSCTPSTVIGSSTSGTTYAVSWDTTTLANGSYLLQATKTDHVGNSSTTSTVAVSISNAYTFGLGSIGTQTAGVAFGGFTIQLQLNGANTTNFSGSAYTGAKAITFSGPGTAPDATHAPSYPATVSFTNGLATVGATAITLYKAETTSLTAKDGTAITGTSGSFAVNSAGVALSYNHTCPLAVAKNSSTPFTINVPSDAFLNPFTRNASLGISLSLTNSGNWGFGLVGTASTTVNITTGPANNTFTLAESGASKTTTITATAPTGFTAPGSCIVNSGS
jgi:hypothetical protein